MGKHGSETEAKILRHEMGLDRPLFDQYIFYLKQCATLDFGRSWATNQKITSMIASGIGASLSLSIPAFTLTIVLAILISIFAAFKRGSLFDRALQITSLAGISVSALVYIIAGQYFLSYQMGWFPISGYDTSWAGRWQYLQLPIVIWLLVSIGYEVLLYRTSILDEIYQDHIRTARAKGLPERIVLLKHVLKSALVPIITNIIIEIPFLFTGALLLEAFFSIPGLGGMVVQGISNSDFPVIKAMTFISAILYMVCNLITDVCYALVDPRIKLG
jgi:peptide/nickel transport system permease protein